MLFWILLLITTSLMAIFVAPLDIIGAILGILLLTLVDVVIMGALSLALSERNLEEERERYPILHVSNDMFTYRDNDAKQVSINRDFVVRGECVRPEEMEYYEVVSYKQNAAFRFWLWDIVGYEVQLIEHLRPYRY
jgi:hypothetical protein